MGQHVTLILRYTMGVLYIDSPDERCRYSTCKRYVSWFASKKELHTSKEILTSFVESSGWPKISSRSYEQIR